MSKWCRSRGNRKGQKRRAYFPLNECEKCPFKDKCLTKIRGEYRRLNFTLEKQSYGELPVRGIIRVTMYLFARAMMIKFKRIHRYRVRAIKEAMEAVSRRKLKERWNWVI